MNYLWPWATPKKSKRIKSKTEYLVKSYSVKNSLALIKIFYGTVYKKNRAAPLAKTKTIARKL